MASLTFASLQLASSTAWRWIWGANLILLSLDHLSTGLLGVFAPRRAIGIYRALFGLQFPEIPEIVAVLRPWGALAVFAAVATIFPIVDPVRYRGVLVALLVLLILRIFIRFSARATATALFALSSRRNAWHIALIAVCALLIALELLSL
jgi:hypothetical protein